MAKWADYLVSEVHYNDKHTHIDKIHVREDRGDSIGAATEMERTALITKINSKFTAKTIYKNEGKWKLGDNIDVEEVDGVEYLRTDGNKIKADNLGELPEY